MWYTSIKGIQDFCNIKQKQEIYSDKNSWTAQADSIYQVLIEPDLLYSLRLKLGKTWWS